MRERDEVSQNILQIKKSGTLSVPACFLTEVQPGLISLIFSKVVSKHTALAKVQVLLM